MTPPSYRYVVLHERVGEYGDFEKRYDVELILDHGRGRQRKELGLVERYAVPNRKRGGGFTMRWRWRTHDHSAGREGGHERWGVLSELLNHAKVRECHTLAREASTGEKR